MGERWWQLWHRRKPTIFERRWWDDQLLNMAISDESIKVQMFRFVDVLPRLKSHVEVTRHLQEYFDEVRHHLPWAVELVKMGIEAIHPQSVWSRALAYNARQNTIRMARRFIAGSTPQEVLQTIRDLRRQGFGFTLDLLGEAVISEPEAERYQQQYLNLIHELAPIVEGWPIQPCIDEGLDGLLPRLNLSLKLSALVSHFRPIDPEGTSAAVRQRLRPLLRAALQHDTYVHIDMEQYAYKDLTLQIFKQIMMEEEFRGYPHVGIVIQSYLPDSEQDLKDLRDWVERRGTPITVRLVKGAYWDYETVVCASRGWPAPVYLHKWETDAAYERLTRFLLEHHRWLRPAFGSHNIRSIAHALASAQALRVPTAAIEIQMLFGMATELAEVFRDEGYRVRIYTPFGELIPGMAYLVRRLLENTSNDSFLRHGYAEDVSVETLLMNPVTLGARPSSLVRPIPARLNEIFRNEPHTDFSRAASREAMQQALAQVGEALGEDYPLVIAGKVVSHRPYRDVRNPALPSQCVGRVAMATRNDVVQAIEAARRAFPSWSRLPVEYRAEYLELLAREMRDRRFELAAWQVYEVGKPWQEADADVCEAIDFCMYYAAQMRELAHPRAWDLPGEENRYSYRPRGVAVVIAPWNFPLAILTGMTTAALVTGNTVIMKPAEQSSVIAAKLMQMFQNIGLPDSVVQYLPGLGEEIGPPLVTHPEVDMIAFTGSRQVGLSIQRHVVQPESTLHGIKYVIAEMGGKNAIIVDSDADLDEAVQGVITSAFGYAGQKCSACSRVIVLADTYDEFLDRLIPAAEALCVAPPLSPKCDYGPVIDQEAYQRIRQTIHNSQSMGTLVLDDTQRTLPETGYFIGPHIFVNVDPGSALAQEEIFGPVLCVFKARDLTEALQLANNTSYALTGGCYSRSPANLQRVRQEFQVGNLYLNRPITGALVGRQPFGGFKLSGIGSKAGGPDYLYQFLIPINVTENTMRRGFAPPVDQDSSASTADTPSP